MSLLSDIENAIIVKLQPLVALYEVAIGKLDDEQLSRPVQNKQIFVSYRRTSFSAPLFMDRISMRQEVEFEILTRGVDSRTHDAFYPILDAIISKLTGFHPIDSFRPLIPKSQDFDGRYIDDSIFAYLQVFTLILQFEQTENFDG